MQVTDGNQNVVASYKYDAWGNDLVDPQSQVPNPFRYVGKYGYYLDTESALMLLGVRYYVASIGRFVSLDPKKDGLNWYGYVRNQPINAIDPTGTIPSVIICVGACGLNLLGPIGGCIAGGLRNPVM